MSSCSILRKNCIFLFYPNSGKAYSLFRFMVLRGSALKILENPDDLELGKMNMGTSLAILSQLLDTTSVCGNPTTKF